MSCSFNVCHSHTSNSPTPRTLILFNQQSRPLHAKTTLQSAALQRCPLRACRRTRRLLRRSKQRCRASGPQQGPEQFNSLDSNQLQTALNTAIKAEDYAQAARISNRLKELQGADANAILDWRSFGCPDWLAERAEQMGFRFPQVLNFCRKA